MITNLEHQVQRNKASADVVDRKINSQQGQINHLNTEYKVVAMHIFIILVAMYVRTYTYIIKYDST